MTFKMDIRSTMLTFWMTLNGEICY